MEWCQGCTNCGKNFYMHMRISCGANDYTLNVNLGQKKDNT